MNKKDLVPSGISSLRLIALPMFLYFFSNGATTWCIIVFGLAMITDLIDGYVARRLGVASRLGAYFDAAIDFILIAGTFLSFVLNDYYPGWILLLIAVSFALFVLTSFYSKKLYDPLGKYIGSVLYIAIGLTLLFPTAQIFLLVEIVFPIFAVTSFVTRIASLTAHYKRNLVIQTGRQHVQPHTA